MIKELMHLAVEKSASDLHLSVGEPPILRIHGDLERVGDQPLTQAQVQSILKELMTEQQLQKFSQELEADFSYELENLARFRINAFHQRRGLAIVMRLIPVKIPTFEELGLSDIFKRLCHFQNGLILVTGPTGSGKSTTLAAMINYLNNEAGEHSHLITIEDPVEFIYQSKHCLINQREVGHDTLNFNAALRAALREDPDILLVGEMRDLETIRLALTAAETGHLVFATMHTNSAAKTIDRIVDVFPHGESNVIRAMLAESLQAVVAQTLLKRVGGGRVAAQEILISTPAIKNLIREQKVPQIYSAIQTGRALGMRTMDQHIEELVAQGDAIAPETKDKN